MLVGPYPYHIVNTYIGSMAQEYRLNITANNLANANTPGFKKDVAVFDGYMVRATKTYFGQGSLRQTNRKLDVALNGPGFIQVETPQGIRYTRNGAFTLDAQGQIVTLNGHTVTGAGLVPAGTKVVSISEDGVVRADGDQIGELNLVEFPDRNVLEKEGKGYFKLKTGAAGGEEATKTKVTQGFLEMSNVNPVMASIDLIDTLRTYEVYQKVVQSFQEADQKSINEVGRLI